MAINEGKEFFELGCEWDPNSWDGLGLGKDS